MIKKLIGCMFVGFVLTLIETSCLGVVSKAMFMRCYLFIEQMTYGAPPSGSALFALEPDIKSKAMWMLFSIEFVLITFMIIIFVAGISLIRSKPKTK